MRELTPPSEQAKIGKRVRQVLNAIFNPTQMVFQGKRRLAGTSAQYVQTTGRCPALKASLLSGTETNMVREQKNYFFLKKPFNFKKTFLTSQPYTYTKQVTIDIRTRNDIALWEHFVLIHVHLNPLGHLCIH